MFMVFSAIAISLIFFRSPDLSSAFDYFIEMTDFGGKNNYILGAKMYTLAHFFELLAYMMIMLGFEWINRANSFGLERISKFKIVRLGTYFILTLLCLHYFYGDNAFVYFQF